MPASLVLGIIAIYFALIICISMILSRGGMRNRDFFNGSRRSPWYIVAISMIGSSISGVTFISVPGMVAASGMSYLQMVLGFVCGYFVIAYVLLPVYYRMELSSIYGYLEQRMGPVSYHTGSAFFLISKFLGCGVRMYLTAVVLQILLFDKLGISFAANVVLTMLIVWLYTFRGGVRTLVWTDMLQTLAMLGAAALCSVFIARELGLDGRGVMGAITDSGMSRIWHFDDMRDTQYFWKQFLAGMFTTVAMTGLDQDMMQKNLSCRNMRDARKNLLSYGFCFLPVNMLFLGLGVLLYRYAGEMGVSGQIRPDELFPTLATSYLPASAGILFVLGLVAAAFSSAGSALTALTTSFTVDILHADRKSDEATLTRTRTWIHAANAVLMALIIMMFRKIGDGSVINAVYTVASYTYGPLLGLYAFGIFTRRQVRDALVAPICVLAPAICLVLAGHSLQWWGFKLGFEVLLINAALTFAGLMLASRRA